MIKKKTSIRLCLCNCHEDGNLSWHFSQLNYIAIFTGTIDIGRSGQENTTHRCRYAQV